MAREPIEPWIEIDAELFAVQGKPVDIGGKFAPDADKTTAVMRLR